MRGVYLIHMQEPIAHAQHYLGQSQIDIFSRYMQHGTRHGSPLLRAAQERGITWRLVRTWPGASRDVERKLKNRHNGRQLCPICNPRIVCDPQSGEAINHPTPNTQKESSTHDIAVPF